MDFDSWRDDLSLRRNIKFLFAIIKKIQTIKFSIEFRLRGERSRLSLSTSYPMAPKRVSVVQTLRVTSTRETERDKAISLLLATGIQPTRSIVYHCAKSNQRGYETKHAQSPRNGTAVVNKPQTRWPSSDEESRIHRYAARYSSSE